MISRNTRLLLKQSFFFLCLFLVLIHQNQLKAQDFDDRIVIRDMPLQLVDNVPICYGGLGSQQTRLQLSGKHIRDGGAENRFLPSLQISSNSFLQFGCKSGNWWVDYTLADDSYKFKNRIEIDGQSYNSVSFHLETVAVDYSFSIIPHYFYLGTGLAYTQISYQLGLFEGNSSTDMTAKETRGSGFLWQGSMKFFLSHFLFLQWRYQQALSQDIPIASNILV